MTKQQQYRKVEMRFENQTYSAEYFVHAGTVTVISGFGKKSTQVGATPEELVAKRLLHELLQKAKQQGELTDEGGAAE